MSILRKIGNALLSLLDSFGECMNSIDDCMDNLSEADDLCSCTCKGAIDDDGFHASVSFTESR